MRIIKTLLFFILGSTTLFHVRCQGDAFCIFGSSADCLLPCRCSSSCDVITGECMDGQCAVDQFLLDQGIAGRGQWSGDACQTGDIGTGKPTEEVGIYYNPGFGINATADKAVDRNISTYAYSRTFNGYGWWMVDLESEHEIEEVHLMTNNLGNSLIGLEHYAVWVGNTTDVFTHSLCGLAPSPLVPGYLSNRNWNKVTCTQANRGRYLSIRKTEASSSKGFLPIHEAVIIGTPISSVRLGYCIRYDQTSSEPGLQSLRCLECKQGWKLPDCRQPAENNGDAGMSTTLLQTSSTVSFYETHHSTTHLKTTSTTSASSSTTSAGMDINPTRNMATESGPIGVTARGNTIETLVILGVVPILGLLLIVAIIVIIILCCCRRQRINYQPKVVSNPPPAPVYFKPQEVSVGNKDTNYEGLQHYNLPTNTYTGIIHGDVDTAYQTIPMDYQAGTALESEHSAYQNVGTFEGGDKAPSPNEVRDDGYLQVIPGNNKEGQDNGIYHSIDN